MNGLLAEIETPAALGPARPSGDPDSEVRVIDLTPPVDRELISIAGVLGLDQLSSYAQRQVAEAAVEALDQAHSSADTLVHPEHQ